MEPQFNTSFIPKKSLQEDVSGMTPGKYVNRRTVHGPGFFLMLFVFIVTIIAAGAVFGYTKVIEGRIQKSLTALDRDRASYKPETINALKRVDERMKGAAKLTASHQAVSAFLSALEAVTLKSVRYSKLELSGTGDTFTQSGRAQVIVAGDAKDLRSVALQADEFTNNNKFRTPLVTSLERSETGGAEFTMQVPLDPSLLSYATTFELEQITVPADATPTEADTVQRATTTGTTTPVADATTTIEQVAPIDATSTSTLQDFMQ
jgi:hypothetical protein